MRRATFPRAGTWHSHAARVIVRSLNNVPPPLPLPVVGLAYLLVYAVGAWALRDYPFARSVFGNIGLLIPAVLVCVVIARRRQHWRGCQRLFWDTVGLGVGLWITGHLGWAFEELAFGHGGWLRWHTLFSLCGGIFPLIALLARPHLGVRSQSVTEVGVLLASYGLFAVFFYTYFVLVPSLVLPEPDAQMALLTLVQINRGALAIGFVSIAVAVRRTAWGATYRWLAIGVTAGFFLRLLTSRAIVEGSYQSGTLFDLAWIAPLVCYASAALTAPGSPAEDAPGPPRTALSAAWAAVPVLLVPLIGYTTLWLQPLGEPGDSFRALLTALLTVAGVGVLTLRLGLQGTELQRVDARRRLLAAATERTQDLILITRTDGSVEHANEAFVRALGYSRAELLRSSFPDLIVEAHACAGTEIHKALRGRGVWRGTLIRRRKDGSTFPAACTVTALIEKGVITHMVGVERDITEERRLQDQLVHTERLSAIGELVAGVAHEINNPLQTVLGSVELMLEDNPSPEGRRDLETIRREAARAAQIVRSLLAFVRRSAPERSPVDLNAIVREGVALREFQLQQKAIRLSVELSPSPTVVLGSREELQQVVMNLLLNAEQAVDTGGQGTVTVRTASTGGLHLIEVADNGPGVSDELTGRIFEPFFTTKPVGEGTGLGLSISHGVALAHGGNLELAPGDRGATFRLVLPAHVDAPLRTAASPQAPPPPSDKPCAVVVDDEAGIRRLVVRMLRTRNYDAVEAASGEEALRVVTTRPVSLVLCDVRMPGMDGLELYRRLEATTEGPVPPFIFMTGDTHSLHSDMPGAATLAKPFTAADLDRALSAMS